MSVGRGYGPVLVVGAQAAARELSALRGARIAVPGLSTTAYLTLRLLLPEFEPVVVPITPYRRTFDALRSGEVDAALLIHEGRLTYPSEGFESVCDLGQAWEAITNGLPLPLGGNAIRRALGADLVAQVSGACRASIRWALEHREETVSALLAAEHRGDLALDRGMLDRYLTMYANSDTLDAPADVRQAVAELYARAFRAGLFPTAPRIEFAP